MKLKPVKDKVNSQMKSKTLKASRFILLADLEGSLEGTPEFQREKLDRDFY